MNAVKNIGVLIFAHSGEAELRHKPQLNNALLFEQLTQKTLQKVRATDLPYLLCSETEQRGTSFGERFVNALQQMYAQGFDAVITIGNDSPQLKTHHLARAARQLQQGKTVLGPTFDGGFYLMGLHRHHFNLQTFLGLPWQHSSLFGQIGQLLRSQGTEMALLPVLHDLDEKRDALLLMNCVRSLSGQVLRLLGSLLEEVQKTSPYIINTFASCLQGPFFNKGSPLRLVC